MLAEAKKMLRILGICDKIRRKSKRGICDVELYSAAG